MEKDIEKNIFYKEQQNIFQNHLIERYNKTLLSIGIGYPVNDKNNIITKNIITCIDRVFNDMVKDSMFMKIFRITFEGPAITILLDLDGYKVKEICSQIEHKHILGGIVDLEVYDANGNLVASKDIKYGDKKCIICGEKDSVCKSKKKHNQSELSTCITNIYKKYTKSHYGKEY